jgi:malonate-semialdehyde dehydrogenase (acetylating) / methylmalonate-semialdehyde dehydrogenase
MAAGSPASTAVRRLQSTARHLSTASGAASPASASAPSTTAYTYEPTHKRSSPAHDTPNFVDNAFVPSATTQWIDVHDPATNELATRVPQSTEAELRAAVDSAQAALPAWRATSVLARQQIMFRYAALIRDNMDRLAASITAEQGKTLADARGDVMRGLQVVETSCGATLQMMGEALEVAKDMETRTIREPLGVVAAICPFSMSSSVVR